MEKVKEFLEKHVQWIALGFGGLFLLYMVFSYVLQSPLQVTTSDGKTFAPGEIDVATLNGPVKTLAQDIKKPGVPEIQIVDYVQDFIVKFQGSGKEFPQLAANGIWGNRMQPIKSDGPLVPGPGGPEDKGKFPVVALPKLPAARPLSYTNGRSQVTFQDPNWVQNPNRPQELPVMITTDKDWWSGLFVISADALAKSFSAAFDEKKLEQFGLPDPMKLMETALIDVELIRQEKLPNGRFGNETTVPILANSLRPPFPGKQAKEQEILQFVQEITTMPQELVAPAFYAVLAGDPWVRPGEEQERLAAMNRDQRRQQLEQLRAQQKQQQQQQRQMRVQPGAGVGLAPEEMGMMDEMAPEIAIPRAGIPRPVVPGQRPPQGVPLAPGRNNNVQMLADIEIVAHDDTVEPGKTYRYKLRYRLLNPIWKKARLAPPELLDQHAIVAADSEWTKPTTMRPKVEFFIASAGNEQGTFEVFEWKNGQMKMSTIKANPGDAIGETGWTMVDVRGAGRTAYALVMDDAGQVRRRDPASDKENLRYEDLKFEVELGASPAVGMNNP